MKKNLFSIIVLVLLIQSLGMSQDFKSAAGLRLGSPTSVSYKTFISENSALEGYIGLRNYGFTNFINISAAYQIHKDLEVEEIENLQWYYGFGGNLYLWTFDLGSGTTSFGVSAYAGLSYTFEDTPINVSVDWVPTFFINGRDGYANGFGGTYGSLAVRYILNSNSEND